VLYRLNLACEKEERIFCVTPNPEICLRALKDHPFQNILRSADLSIPDGFGILWASRYLRGSRNFFRWIWTLLTPGRTLRLSDFPERVTGTDVMNQFVRSFPQRKIFLLGASSDVNDRLTKKLLSAKVRVVGNFSGDPSPKNDANLREKINASQAEVLFVAFGAPKQEAWIARNFSSLRTVRVAMGVGGAFDFLAESKKRAPRWMRSWGLEWLYRVFIEPSRLKRILHATIVFPWKVYRLSS
jgi:N-acetylglucosaminyldiphosphoundecaprenol N-acetyl-beta-D-mannosaminyltransferase